MLLESLFLLFGRADVPFSINTEELIHADQGNQCLWMSGLAIWHEVRRAFGRKGVSVDSITAYFYQALMCGHKTSSGG